MLRRCPLCSTDNPAKTTICSGCGGMLEAGFPADGYVWNEKFNGKPTFVSASFILCGVILTMVLSNIIPTVAGLALAALYFIRNLRG
jgi:hypothetical protein